MRIFIPGIDKGIYYDIESLQNVVIYRSESQDNGAPSLFFENTTTLIEFKVNRETSYVTLSEKPTR
jgi:hypothetical protein